jgi:SAM-dependent methyltransferase
MKTKGLSHPATTQRVLELLSHLDWREARVADVGAGRGHFSHVLQGILGEEGLNPEVRVFPCDLEPANFEVEGLQCRRLVAGEPIPFDDEFFDAVVSLEVIEHVEDQFTFLRELVRITRPGGAVVVTTPNVLHGLSRLRTLTQGFPSRFGPLSLDSHDHRHLGGHIHPISPYFLAYAAKRAGLRDVRLLADRTKCSAAIAATLLWPLLAAGRSSQSRRLRRESPDVLAQNEDLLAAVNGRALLTGRSVILSARKAD